MPILNSTNSYSLTSIRLINMINRYLLENLKSTDFIKNIIYGLSYLDESIVLKMQYMINTHLKDKGSKQLIDLRINEKTYSNRLLVKVIHRTNSLGINPLYTDYIDLMETIEYNLNDYYKIEDLELFKLTLNLKDHKYPNFNEEIFKKYILQYINKDDLEIIRYGSDKIEEIESVVGIIKNLIKVILLYINPNYVNEFSSLHLNNMKEHIMVRFGNDIPVTTLLFKGDYDA